MIIPFSYITFQPADQMSDYTTLTLRLQPAPYLFLRI